MEGRSDVFFVEKGLQGLDGVWLIRNPHTVVLHPRRAWEGGNTALSRLAFPHSPLTVTGNRARAY
jgi:hypothetical protein